MKCPKCGFTSFDYLESCKKCGNDLVGFKAKHGLRSLLFPGLGRAAAAPVQPEEAETAEEALLTDASDATDFGFGFMDEEPAAPAAAEESTAEDETFLTDGEPQADPTGIAPPEDFDLAGAGDEFNLEGEADDLFDLDDDSTAGDLPPLDEPGAFDFDAGEDSTDLFGEDSELPSWDDLEEEQPAKKPAGQEEPSDPFEDRESAVAGRAPEDLSGHLLEPEAAPVVLAAGPALIGTAAEPSPQPAAAAPHPEAAPEDPALAGLEAAPGDAGWVPTASLVGRLGAFLADLLLLALVLGGFLLLGQRLLAPGNSSLLPDAALVLRLATPYFLLLFLACFCYFTLFHLLLGQTPGKMLFGLGVVALDGSPLAPAQAILRSTGGLAALCLAGLGYAAILFDGAGRGWNDRLAGTRVVPWPPVPIAAADGAGDMEEAEERED